MERVPAREQRVDLEAPGQLEHVLERPGFCLRNVDRILALVDARLHAVVADAVAGRADCGIVDDDHRESADGPAFALELVEFRDALLERTTGERLSKGAFLEDDWVLAR